MVVGNQDFRSWVTTALVKHAAGQVAMQGHPAASPYKPRFRLPQGRAADSYVQRIRDISFL